MLGKTLLDEGVDYKLSYANNIKAGTATITVTGKGDYRGSASGSFTIGKASQAISAKSTATKALTASLKTAKLAKNQTIDLKALAKVSAKSAVKYTKANGAGGKLIVVNAKTGKVTAKKGLAAGTYSVKVRLAAPANSCYLAAKAKAVTLKIVIKAPQVIKAKASVSKTLSASAKAKKLAKSASFSLKSLAKISAKTTVKYTKVTGAGGKLIVVNAKTGKVTAKKGLGTGTYKVKVKLTAPASARFKAAKAKAVTLKLVVK